MLLYVEILQRKKGFGSLSQPNRTRFHVYKMVLSLYRNTYVFYSKNSPVRSCQILHKIPTYIRAYVECTNDSKWQETQKLRSEETHRNSGWLAT